MTTYRNPKPTLAALTQQVMDLQLELAKVRMSIPKETQLRSMIDGVVSLRAAEIGTLTEHAAKALRLLIDAGVITQDQANEAIR